MKNLSLAFLLAAANVVNAQTTNSSSQADTSAAAETTAATAIPVLKIDASNVKGKVSPTLYGLMTEEINFSYEGGLYGELIRNRSFKADAIQQPMKPADYDSAKYYPVQIAVTNSPKYWEAINSSISLDTNNPLNEMLNVSCKVDASKASKNTPAGIANGGYWGIPVKPNTTYKVSFYAKAKKFSGPLTVSLVHVLKTNEVKIQSPKDHQFYLGEASMPVASATIPKISSKWKKYEVELTTGNVEPSKENKLTITTTKPGSLLSKHGTIWFQQVSMFPPTYKNQPNGRRADIMQLLADMQPKFLRFPGGNYVEGDYFNERFNWKEMIGPIDQRPGHRSCWNYWSTDGFGLPEFLGWCQDLNMEPVLAVFAGYTLKRDHIEPGPKLEPYVQEALEEIEYVTGDANTKWGAQRVKDGYPNPFKLRYVEIGNEDWFDRSGSYDGRFAQFYDAIKAKYPDLQIISTGGYERPVAQRVHSRVPDLVDEHYYRNEEEMEAHALDYDKYSRTNPTKIFVGEWATRVGSPTPNMAGALGDAAWMTGMERNSDIVHISCYAPLFVNVSDLKRGGSMQWPSDLIGYDALNSYGSPSYYAQKMFSTHHGDEILATETQNVPTREWQPRQRTRNGVPEGNPPPLQQIHQMFFDATRKSADGTIIVKVVNALGAAQPVNIVINGVNSVESKGTAIVLKADAKTDTNSIQEPKKIVPVTTTVHGLSANFTREFPPYSITVLELKSK